MSKVPNSSNNKATISIFGDVGASDFVGWILRHAAKLGLGSLSVEHFDEHLEVQAEGASELLEALSLACSLGPASVLVDRIECNLQATD
ncbi:MAG: acylphosphatase [Amylibacter sp.]